MPVCVQIWCKISTSNKSDFIIYIDQLESYITQYSTPNLGFTQCNNNKEYILSIYYKEHSKQNGVSWWKHLKWYFSLHLFNNCWSYCHFCSNYDFFLFVLQIANPRNKIDTLNTWRTVNIFLLNRHHVSNEFRLNWITRSKRQLPQLRFEFG